MVRTIALLLLLSILTVSGVIAEETSFEQAIYSDKCALSFFPDYPLVIGEETTIVIRTFSPTQKVTIYTDRDVEIPLTYRDKRWYGKYIVPSDYQEGGHFFTVWIKLTKFGPSGIEPAWSKSKIWYKAFRRKPDVEKITARTIITTEAETLFKLPLVTGEAVEIKVLSPEVTPILIKGSQTINFKSRTFEGSKEGYTPGTFQTREETLRVNVSGKAAETDIEANIYRSSTAQIGGQEEKVSILLRRGSTEAYLGDFTANLIDTEFTRLDKVLSGGKLKGNYDKWGFEALFSSPRGESKFIRLYGNNTQGPFRLNFSPVVIDSERVYLDGVLQKRGDDYSIDYLAGSITFLRRTVSDKSILQIYYDYRQTLYSHSTYGIRGFYKPIPNLKIGATYLEDSDSLDGAETIKQSSSIDPKRHYVIGADGNYNSEKLQADGEIAYSFRNLNLLSAQASEEVGRAVKLNISSNLGPFGFAGYLKRIGANFRPIADPDPKQDLNEYRGSLSYRPGSLYSGSINYDYQKYRQSGVVYENIYKNLKALFIPDQLPSLEYNYSAADESNDPVSGSLMQRVITKNSAETLYQFGIWSTSLKGSLENWLRRSPSEEVTDYRKINWGLATIGLEKVSFSSNLELESRKEPDQSEPYRRSLYLKASANPSKEYFISSAYNQIENSVQGESRVLDLAYRAQPTEIFRTDGKYTINTVDEEFPVTPEVVSKQSGSFSFELRPFNHLRLRYLLKPNFTAINRTGAISYKNDQQQAEINLIPINQLMLGLVYKLNSCFNIYKYDYPNYNVKEKEENTDEILYTLKMAPLQILSIELNYQTGNSSLRTLTATQEPYTYLDGKGKANKIDLSCKTSLSEKFSIDTRYTYQKNDQGTGESASNTIDSETHTGTLKGIWNISDFWSYSVFGSFSQSQDNILKASTYTVSPGFGLIYRWYDQLRSDFEYTYSKSYNGAETEKNIYSFKTRYSLSDFVNVSFRADHENSRSPDYKITDISTNIEINL